MNFKNLFLGLFIALSSTGIAQKIVGYIPQYRTTAWMDGAIEWDKMTDYYYFGSIPTAGGGITIEQSARFQHVLDKATTYSKNVWLSVGGWGKSSNFIGIANNASYRQAFANEALSICQTYGLTGIDIDWEFPAYGQEAAFRDFFKTLYETLNPQGYLVSAAAGGEATHADKWLAETFNYIDDLNIMSYDAPNAYSNHASLQFMKDAMTIYNGQGCPYSKMLGGVAFYGRCGGEVMYSTVLNAAADKQYAYENDNGGGYCYNGKNTITDKIDYVMGQGGIGILIWEVSQDVLGQYSLLNACDLAMDPYRCSAASPSLGNDQSICGVASITLDGGVSAAAGRTFTWKKGASTLVNQNASASTYSATTTGVYTLEVWENGCFRSDEIEITGVLNAVDLGGPYELCSPVSVTLDAAVNPTGKTISWEKDNVIIGGESSSTYTATRAGTYKVTVSAAGCSSVSSSAVVTSNVPYATNDTVCSPGDEATLTASESVNWYSSEVSPTILSTGTVYSPTITSNTTFWMGGTGAAATTYTTMKSAFVGGWQANGQVYANKLIVAAEITIDEVTVNSAGGNVVINLVESDGVTVVKTKTFNGVSGKTALDLNWSGIQPGTYYLNTAGTSNTLWVDSQLDGSDYVVSGVITVERRCYADWSAPYGDAYAVSTNYGNFLDLKVTAGSACDRVPVQAIIDASNPTCLTVGSEEIVEHSFKVFPNPSNDVFTLSTNTKWATVRVLDLKGAIVEEFSTNSNLTKFGNDLEAGIYFVQVQSSEGSSVRKIIKR